MSRRALVLAAALVAALAVAPAPAAEVDFNLFAGVELDNSVDVGDVDTDVATGYSLGLEVVVDLPVVEVGGGLEYGFPRDFEGTDAEYEYLYAYGVGRVSLLPFLYVLARLGYADISTDGLARGSVDGSTTWSAGAGFKLVDWFKLEAMYTRFSGDLDADSIHARVVFSF